MRPGSLGPTRDAASTPTETAPFADPPFDYTPAKSTEQMAADVAAAIIANIRN